MELKEPSKRSAIEKVLEIPELVCALCSRFTFSQLGRFSRISKRIYRLVAPHLWRYYALGHSFKVNPSPGLARNRKHLRSLEYLTIHTGILDIILDGHVHNNNNSKSNSNNNNSNNSKQQQRPNAVSTAVAKPVTGRKELPIVTNLVQFIYTGDRHGEVIQEHQLDQLLQILIDNGSTLEVLQIHVDLISKRPHEFISVLSNNLSWTLTSLIIRDGVDLELLPETLTILGTVFGLPNLTILRLTFGAGLDPAIDYPPEVEADLFQQTLDVIQQHKLSGRFPFRLQELELPDYDRRYSSSFLLPFFELGFPSLICWHVPRIRENYAHELNKVFANHCTSLQDIRMNGAYCGRMSDHETLRVGLHACQNLGLRSFEFSEMLWEPIRVFVLQYRYCIESLVIKNSAGITSADVQVILSACPALHTFKVLTEGDRFVLNLADFQIYEDEDNDGFEESSLSGEEGEEEETDAVVKDVESEPVEDDKEDEDGNHNASEQVKGNMEVHDHGDDDRVHAPGKVLVMDQHGRKPALNKKLERKLQEMVGLLESNVLQTNFSCLGLKTLWLIPGDLQLDVLKKTSSASSTTPPSLSSSSPSSARGLFWQIGRLTALEELVIGYDPPGKFQKGTIERMGRHFTLDPEEGQLKELAGLKKLKMLHLMGPIGSHLSKYEVEWMEREWPSLESVTFTTKGRPKELELQKPHWQEFLKRRPCLKVHNLGLA